MAAAEQASICSQEHLVLAHEGFDKIGAHGWERLVRAELVALGEGIPEPATTGAGLLTPQELQVVRHAARGLSNREIAAELFLSPRTVGYHLYKAYPKAGRQKARVTRPVGHLTGQAWCLPAPVV